MCGVHALCGADILKPIEQLRFKTVLIPSISDQGLSACVTFQPILTSLASPWLLEVEILQNGLVKWTWVRISLHYQRYLILLFSDVPKMATPPDGITFPVGNTSVMNALTTTTEGLFTDDSVVEGVWQGPGTMVTKLKLTGFTELLGHPMPVLTWSVTRKSVLWALCTVTEAGYPETGVNAWENIHT